MSTGARALNWRFSIFDYSCIFSLGLRSNFKLVQEEGRRIKVKISSVGVLSAKKKLVYQSGLVTVFDKNNKMLPNFSGKYVSAYLH